MQPSTNTDLDLLQYLELILRRKKTVLAVTITASLVAVAVALALPKTYRATARIIPPQHNDGSLGFIMSQMAGGTLSDLAGSLTGAGSAADQCASIMQTERVKDTIIDRFTLMEQYNKKYRLDMYHHMDQIIAIKAGKKDGIITISVEDEDPKKAAAMANAYIDETGKVLADLSTSSAGHNRTFLEGRLAQARADLARAENAIKSFQSKTSAISVTDQAKASIEGVAALKAQLAVHEAQLAALRSQFTDSTQEIQATLASVRNLKGQIAKLEGTGTGAIPSVGSVPGLGQEQIRLFREFKIQETLVELLTKQYELAKLTEAKDTAGIQVVQKATVPDKKVKPKRILIVAGTAFFSFFGSILWILVNDLLASLPEETNRRWSRVKAAFSGQ